MKWLPVLILTACLATKATAQYWQQRVDYTMDVTLNDREQSLQGFAKIRYQNNSPDTLHFIWFHVWPNAYKNDQTAYSDQALENGSTRFYFSDKNKRGYINKLDFKVNGSTAGIEDHPQHIDIIKLVLPKPLPPGQNATITTPFHVKLPAYFSRSGHDNGSFYVTQWYPKPAVYDQKGWHPMPYLDQGEFYNNFGDYDVRITLPRNYVVAATGQLQDASEIQWLKELTLRGNTTILPAKNNTVKQPPPSAAELKTLQYVQENVHDFAWFASKDFLVNSDTLRLPSGRVIEVFSFFTQPQASFWKNSVRFTKEAIQYLSARVGEYPYQTVSVVQGPASDFSGGMEYPTVTLISPVTSEEMLDRVIAHEVFHNWFQQVLASNERRHPWMDEGLTSFYEEKYMASKYGKEHRANEILFQTSAVRRTDQPIELPATEYSSNNYGLVVYHKTAEWLRLLERQYGAAALEQVMQQYFSQWKFRHPYPEDFDSVARSFLPGVDNYLRLRSEKGLLPSNELRGFTIISPLRSKSFRQYIYSPTRNVLLIAPALGVNKYDGAMLGALFSNYRLPPGKLQFLAAPMYATRSKQLTGLAKLNYSIHSYGPIRKTDLFVNGASFSLDDFADTSGKFMYMKFSKLVPGIRVTLRERSARSTGEKYLQWKTFFLREQGLRILQDTVFTGSDTALVLRYSTPQQATILNQLRLVFENSRELYPYQVALNIDQGKGFVRPTVTANYFFNYARGGGLNLRFFAGKFFYLGGESVSKQFETERYHLNMTGPKGYEDYTYGNYFVGRNEFEGFSSQQIMIRDGAFKVRTDLLANKVGKTDNWLLALNFSTSIPSNLNPLSVLPVKIPLRFFFDLGTYAEAWDRNAEADRILYDAGFHLPLFRETVNIYIPIAFSKVYADYFKSTIEKNRLLRTISFSIDLNKTFEALNRQLAIQ